MESETNLKKDILEKINEGKLVSESTDKTQKWSKIVNIKLFFFGLRNSLLIGLGQDQQQHPVVHNGGVSTGRICGCGCWR